MVFLSKKLYPKNKHVFCNFMFSLNIQIKQTPPKISVYGLPVLCCIYLKVVKRKEGLRLPSLFLYVLNTISAGLL